MTERPASAMRMLPEVIPLADSRALAREVISPYLDNLATKGDGTKAWVLQVLAHGDPSASLRELGATEFANARMEAVAQRHVAGALARTDSVQAESVAVAIKAPDLQVIALLDVVDAIRDQQRGRALALLDRAAAQTKAVAARAMRLAEIGEVAERWCELGEKSKAQALFADGLMLAHEIPDKTDPVLAYFAARLVRANPTAALSLAREFPATGSVSVGWVLRNVAYHLAADDPAEAERTLRLIQPEAGHDWAPPAIAWRMAKVDPARARRLVEESQRFWKHPEMYLFLAAGLHEREPAAARDAFQIAMRGIDRAIGNGTDRSPVLRSREVLLPLVEQLDPALVPEYFWRIVAMRPATGNPRAVTHVLEGSLVLLLAWYDRAVAAALFERIPMSMEPDDARRTRGWLVEFLGWSILEPRAAVARLAQIPIDSNLTLNQSDVKRRVSEVLGLSYEDRWRKIWGSFTEMGAIFERDLR